jgi:hypothetical protein
LSKWTNFGASVERRFAVVHWIDRESKLDRGLGVVGLRIQQRIGPLVSSQQCVETPAESKVAGAFAVQERRAFGGRLCDSQGEEGLFAFMRR